MAEAYFIIDTVRKMKGKIIVICTIINLFVFTVYFMIPPGGNDLLREIHDLKKRVDAMQNTSQPYLSIWQDLPEPVIYSAANQIQFENTQFPAFDILQPGYKIRIAQPSYAPLYRGFFINAFLGNNTYSLIPQGIGGDLVNEEITEIGYSNAQITSNPSVDSGSFNGTITPAPGMTSSELVASCNISPLGYLFVVTVNGFTTLGGVLSNYVEFSTPIRISSAGGARYGTTLINNGNYVAGSIEIMNSDPLSLRIYKADHSNFVAGELVVNAVIIL